VHSSLFQISLFGHLCRSKAQTSSRFRELFVVQNFETSHCHPDVIQDFEVDLFAFGLFFVSLEVTVDLHFN